MTATDTQIAQIAAGLRANRDRTMLFAPPAGCTGHAEVAFVGNGYRVQIGGKLTGTTGTYTTAGEAARAIFGHRQTNESQEAMAAAARTQRH